MSPRSYSCGYCGSTNLRRSHRRSLPELLEMSCGSYPFRCLQCNQRTWINVWLFSKLAVAKCPKCLNLDLTNWAHKRYHLSLWKKLLMSFGARRYRCARCRYNFLSFRPRQIAGLELDPAEGTEATANGA